VELITDKNLFPTIELSLDEYASREDFHIFDLQDQKLIDKIINKRPLLYLAEPLTGLTDEQVRTIAAKIYDTEDTMAKMKDHYNLLRFYKLGIVKDKAVRETNISDAVLEDGQIYLKSSLSDLSFIFGHDRDYDFNETFKSMLEKTYLDEMELDFDTDLKAYDLSKINKANLALIFKLTASERARNKKYSSLTLKEFTGENTNKFYYDYIMAMNNEDVTNSLLEAITFAQNEANVGAAIEDFIDEIKKFFKIPKNKDFRYDEKGNLLLPFKIEWIKDCIKSGDYPRNNLKGYLESEFIHKKNRLLIDVPADGWAGKIDDNEFNTRLTLNLKNENKLMR
jgi:hypothetical protein